MEGIKLDKNNKKHNLLNNKKKILTPFEKLNKRILKEFPKKKFIGDIIINDEEYEMLIEYFKIKYEELKNSYTHVINDPVFAAALVQIGIKNYDGNFWSNLARIVATHKINTNYQNWIGESFIITLISNNKVMLDKSEKVNNILMHGFISDFYANSLFDFLFKYYNIDLERDLNRNNTAMMNELFMTIQKNDNTGRTYLLVKQTSDAISVNTRGGKIRIRRLLKLIDQCFWEQITPINPVNRLSKLFNNWQKNSSEFKLQYNKYNGGITLNRGKKNYSSPYIKCDFYKTTFKLVLPKQIINFQYNRSIKWKIYCREKCSVINAQLYQAVTGYKTEIIEIDINKEEIFNEFIIELTHQDTKIRSFKIKKDCIRFFDNDGDYLNSDNNLPNGEVYAFSRVTEVPRSDALIEIEPIGSLARSYFELEYGDIVRLPDGKVISIGKRFEEGLLPRKVVKGAYALNNGEELPIYSAPPTLLLKIAEKHANGTAIEINNKRYRLFDKETTVIELGDRSGETGYILSLREHDCIKDGIYTVSISVPNDKTNRFWQFALLNNIYYEFEDSPYIFKPRGTIRFNDDLAIKAKSTNTIKNTDDNSFNFEISPDKELLEFVYSVKGSSFNLNFDIPVFKWRFGNEKWNIDRPTDIWHSDFPNIIYIKYPDDKICLSMDENIGYEEEEEAVTYIKNKSKGVFECDVTCFKSWLSREKVFRKIFIDLSKNRIEFIKVITQSFIKRQILKGDYRSSKLIGEFDIVGKSNYYVDVILVEKNKKLSEKLPLTDGKFQLETELSSGLYNILVYEDEDDDTGFGIVNYLFMGEFKHNIINPYNLEGKNIELKYIKKSESDIYINEFSNRHIVYNLELVDRDNKHNYKGKLLIKVNGVNNYITYDVYIEFLDLDNLQYVYLTYFDGYDYLEFMYDTNLKMIVKKEEEGLRRAVRYRRYESLYPIDYVYVTEFLNEPFNIKEIKIVKEQQPVINRINSASAILWKERDIQDIVIEEMNFTVRTYNCLKRGGIESANEIVETGINELYKVRNLGKKNIEEICEKMKKLGYELQ